MTDTTNQPATSATRAVVALLILILAAGAFLRFYRIGSQSLWDDEISSIEYAKQSIPDLWRNLQVRDANPPLFYFVYHYWREAGTSEAAYRALPALLGVIALLLCFAIARRLGGVRLAIVATAFAAINPLLIYCSQEVRSHNIFLVVALAAVLFYVRLMDSARARDAIGLAVFAALSAYTHYYAFFLVLALIVHAAILGARTVKGLPRAKGPLLSLAVVATQTHSAETRQEALLTGAAIVETMRLAARGLLLFAGSMALAGLFYLPWLKGLMLQMMQGSQAWRPYTPPWTILRDALAYATVAHSPVRLPSLIPGIASWQDGGIREALIFSLVLAGVLLPYLALIVSGAKRWTEMRYRGRALVLAWALVPLAAILIVTQKVHLFDPRHLVAFVPAVSILTAAGLIRLGSKNKALAVVAGLYVLCITGASLAQYYHDPAFQKQDWRGAYERILEASRAGDVIVGYHPTKLLGLAYYADGKVPIRYLIEEGGSPGEGRVADRAREIADNAKRVWLVDYHGFFFDRDDTARSVLRESMTLADRWAYAEGPRRFTVELFTKSFAEASGGFTPRIDFATGEFAPGQLLDGWMSGRGDDRFMAREAEAILRNDMGSSAVRLMFRAPYELLGGEPFVVRVFIEGIESMSTRVESGSVHLLEGPIPRGVRGKAYLRVRLVSEETFRPSDVAGVANDQELSLAVRSIELE